MTPAEVAQRLDLARHPEGGWYRETWRASTRVPVPRGGTAVERAAGTSILYLLGKGDVSRFHRIESDEVWYHQGGGAIVVHVLTPAQMYECMIVGAIDTRGAALQHVVPAGAWFAAELSPGAAWGLAGCAVAPGFDFDDFALADGDALVAAWPEHEPLIRRLT